MIYEQSRNRMDKSSNRIYNQVYNNQSDSPDYFIDFTAIKATTCNIISCWSDAEREIFNDQMQREK